MDGDKSPILDLRLPIEQASRSFAQKSAKAAKMSKGAAYPPEKDFCRDMS
jgi:hypothetical protein